MFENMLMYAALYAAKTVIYGWIIGIFSGFFAVFALDNLKRENELSAEIFGAFSAVGLVLPIAYFSLNLFLAERVGLSQISFKYLVFWGICTLAGVGLGVWFHRSFTSTLDIFKSKITKKTALERNKKTDVRSIEKILPTAISYDPSKYFDKEKGIFLGLAEDESPLYWPSGRALPHIAISGTTGSGKGVAIQVLLSQCAAQGHAILALDPKNDEWMPHALKAAADAAGVPFHFLDLRPEAPPQLNLFDGATRHQINELLQAGFALAEKGDNADFYRLKDRQSAAAVAAAVRPGDTPAAIYARMSGQLSEGFDGNFKEMAEIPAVNGVGGLDLAGVVANGGVIYAVGSMRFEPVKRLQKMLAMRLIQIAEQRERLDVPLRPVGILMDEFIYHISRGALEALGAARDKGVYMMLCYQGLGDIARVPADLNVEAVRGAIVENCKLKMSYQIQDPETALWIASATGTIQADDESRKVEKNLAMVETLEAERTIRQTERYLIDENMLMNLPEGVGVVIGLKGIVKGVNKGEFISVSRLNVKKDASAICPTACAGGGYQPPSFDDLPDLPSEQSKPAVEMMTFDDDLPPLPHEMPFLEEK